jgi:hypothetical protein
MRVYLFCLVLLYVIQLASCAHNSYDASREFTTRNRLQRAAYLVSKNLPVQGSAGVEKLYLALTVGRVPGTRFETRINSLNRDQDWYLGLVQRPRAQGEIYPVFYTMENELTVEGLLEYGKKLYFFGKKQAMGDGIEIALSESTKLGRLYRPLKITKGGYIIAEEERKAPKYLLKISESNILLGSATDKGPEGKWNIEFGGEVSETSEASVMSQDVGSRFTDDSIDTLDLDPSPMNKNPIKEAGAPIGRVVEKGPSALEKLVGRSAARGEESTQEFIEALGGNVKLQRHGNVQSLFA